MARKLVLVTPLKVIYQGRGGEQGLLVNITKKISWPWKQKEWQFITNELKNRTTKKKTSGT